MVDPRSPGVVKPKGARTGTVKNPTGRAQGVVEGTRIGELEKTMGLRDEGAAPMKPDFDIVLQDGNRRLIGEVKRLGLIDEVGVKGFDAFQAALAVGQDVTMHVFATLIRDGNATVIDPDQVADAISGLVLNTTADEDHNEIADLLAPFWSAQHTSEALGGLKRSSMLARRKTGSLLGVKTTDGHFHYPVAQFERSNGKVRVKPALRKFMMTLRDRDPWTVGILLHTPAPELENLTPLDWVRKKRDEDRLIGYARTVDAEHSR